MAPLTPSRFRPLVFRTGKTLANRVVVPPMASETADVGGDATEATFEHYSRLTPSRAGLIWVEYSYVHPSGRSEERQLGIWNDTQVDGLREIARRIHASGALAGIQLSHGGGKSTQELTGGSLQGPSAIAVPVREGTEPFAVPAAISPAGIREWKSAFAEAIARAEAAGFDLVELHAAHGYGLNQWLSPLTNRREDDYGGDLPGRSRLLLEIVAEARRTHPELLISVRMPGQDFLEGGLTPADSAWIARALETQGADLLDISSVIGGWRRPRDRAGEGYLVAEASAIRAQVGIPVIGVGGIESGPYIDEAIERGLLTLAAVGRAILKDPAGWGAQHLA